VVVTRNLFQHEPPAGVTIRQHFSLAPSDPAHPAWKVEFSAVCDCGTEGPVRAARADAIDDLEDLGHPGCHEAALVAAGRSLFDFPATTEDIDPGGVL
jgi:hypothetical protein